jgi:hypothetical protein
MRSGKKLSKETIDKIAASRKGYIHSEETKIKIRMSNIGKHNSVEVSEETRKKLSLAAKGRESKNKGIKLDRNVREELGNKWEIITPYGTLLMIRNLNLFCQDHNLTYSAMNSISKGKGKYHKGYKCRKVNI